VKFDAEGREWGRGSWKVGSKVEGQGERCKLPRRASGGAPTALWAQKTR